MHLLLLIIMPWLYTICDFLMVYRIAQNARHSDSDTSLASSIDRQFAEPNQGWEHLGCDATIDEYLELAINFCYLMIGSVVLPSVSILVLLHCLSKSHMITYRLQSVSRRPTPQVSTIDHWNIFFRSILYLAVLVNARSLTFEVHLGNYEDYLVVYGFSAKVIGHGVPIFGINFLVLLIARVFVLGVKVNDGCLRIGKHRMQHKLDLWKKSRHLHSTRHSAMEADSLKVRQPSEICTDGIVSSACPTGPSKKADRDLFGLGERVDEASSANLTPTKPQICHVLEASSKSAVPPLPEPAEPPPSVS